MQNKEKQSLSQQCVLCGCVYDKNDKNIFVGIYCKCLSQLFICEQPVVLEGACGVGVDDGG